MLSQCDVFLVYLLDVEDCSQWWYVCMHTGRFAHPPKFTWHVLHANHVSSSTNMGLSVCTYLESACSNLIFNAYSKQYIQTVVCIKGGTDNVYHVQEEIPTCSSSFKVPISMLICDGVIMGIKKLAHFFGQATYTRTQSGQQSTCNATLKEVMGIITR